MVRIEHAAWIAQVALFVQQFQTVARRGEHPLRCPSLRAGKLFQHSLEVDELGFVGEQDVRLTVPKLLDCMTVERYPDLSFWCGRGSLIRVS